MYIITILYLLVPVQTAKKDIEMSKMKLVQNWPISFVFEKAFKKPHKGIENIYVEWMYKKIEEQYKKIYRCIKFNGLSKMNFYFI